MSAESWSADRIGDADGPVVAVFIHGGFWRARFAADTIAPLAQAAASQPPHPWVWNLEYTRVGMPSGGWPGTAFAVRDAVGAAVAAAGARPVVLIGHSAGGHLALWCAREHPVAGAVSLAGVVDLRAAARARLGNCAVSELAGGPPDDAFYAAASPIERLPLQVPALLIHGDCDDNVPIDQSRTYAGAAAEVGDACELRELRKADHFDVIDPDGPAWPILQARLAELAAHRP